MRYVLLALLALALLLTALLQSKLSVIIKYVGGEVSLTFKLWFFKYSLSGANRAESKSPKPKKQKKKKEKPIKEAVAEPENKGDKKEVQEKKEKKGVKEKIKDKLSLFKSAKRAAGRTLKYLKHKIDISKIDVKCKFGTGDAAVTGIICGAVWGAVSNMYVIGGKYFNLSLPSIDLVPVFERKIFEIEAESIIRVRPAHIINAAVLALFTYLMFERKTTKKINSDKSLRKNIKKEVS